MKEANLQDKASELEISITINISRVINPTFPAWGSPADLMDGGPSVTFIDGLQTVFSTRNEFILLNLKSGDIDMFVF